MFLPIGSMTLKSIIFIIFSPSPNYFLLSTIISFHFHFPFNLNSNLFHYHSHYFHPKNLQNHRHHLHH